MIGRRSVNRPVLSLNRLVAAALAISVLGCGPATPPSTSGGPVDATGSWQLAEGQIDGVGMAILADHPITMTAGGTKISGHAACNFYGGEIVMDGGRMRFIATSMTEMACPEPVMAAEAAFIDALGRIDASDREGDSLVLSGSGVRLEFHRLAPVPAAAMVGTDWILDSLVKGDTVSSVAGAPATLRIERGGTLSGSTGCRTFTGKWVTADDSIATPELSMEGECPANLATQDSHVVGVIDGFRVSIDGRTMTLTASGGDGLIYRAAD